MRTDDGSIVQRCLDGESAAFGILVDKYKAGIYAFVYDKLRNFQDAQDVAQEVFLEAYRNLHSLRRWESFGFWLYRIARNQCGKWIRTQSKRPDRDFIENQNPKMLEDSSLKSYRESRVNQSLIESLDSLPEVYREALMLHYFGGMNVKEIAEAIGISPTAVRMRLSRARARLKEEMTGMMDTAFEGQKLQASFTFRVIEAVKHIRIHPISPLRGLPWGLSFATGIILAVMGINPHLTTPEYIGAPIGSPLPSETKVLKVGEIPVDVVKISKTPIISSQQDQDKGKGGKPKLPDLQNAIFLAPRGAGNTWTKKADMPTARDCLSTSVVDGKIYAISGSLKDYVPTKIVEEYDPVNNTWTRKADIPTARLCFSTSVVNGKIYAIGGGLGNLCFPTVEVYDPTTDTWSKGSDMPTARRGLSTSAVNGKIYAIGGDNKFGPCLSTEEYDPVKDTWAKKADMPTARFGLSTSVVDGEIYAMGGIPINQQWWNTLPTVEVYNPATDKWTKRADMPAARTNFATGIVNGKIYAVGGALVPPSVVSSKVEIYDPATDKWIEKAGMTIARGWLAASEARGKIYAIGGSTEVDWLSIVEEYTPEDWPFSVLPQGKLPTKWGMEKER